MLDAPSYHLTHRPPRLAGRRLDWRLLSMTKADRANSFSVLCGEMLGADPWHIASRAGCIGLPLSQTIDHPLLPLGGIEEHASFFEWHFEPETIRLLAGKAGKGAHARVLCLGTPSVAARLAGRVGSVELIDRNPLNELRFPSLHLADRVAFGDVEKLPLGPEVDVTIADPPWYESDILAWTKIAALRTAVGGRVIFTLFPPLVREGAATERARILRAAATIGDLAIDPGVVRYRTPVFEWRSLAASDLFPGPLWRRGDLVTLTLRRHPAPSQPSIRTLASPAADWLTCLVGTQVVRLRPHGDRPEVEGLVASPNDMDDFQLTTLSRRRICQLDFDIWTSRNRVAKYRSAEAILAALRQLRMSPREQWGHLDKTFASFLEL